MTDNTPSDPPQYQPQPGPPGGYPPGGYPAGGYPPAGYPAAGGRRNGIGVAALVFGVVGLVAVLLGIIGLVRANRGEADNRGQAVAGLVTGGLALLLGIFFTISVGTWFATHVNDFRRFGNCMDQANTPAAREQCGRQLS